MTLFSSLWSEANGTNTPLFGDLWAGVSDTGVEALEPLFANGEQGGYWPADPAYAYEDSAGTTAASVNGVVGLRYDRSSGSVAAARRNLLNNTENFTLNGSTGISYVADSIIAPNGTLTADKCIETEVTSEHYSEQVILTHTNQTYTSSVYIKAFTGTGFIISAVAVGSSVDVSSAFFTISNSVISASYFTGLILAQSATAVGDGWYRCAVTYTLNGTVTFHTMRIYPARFGVVSGDTNLGIYLWGQQLDVGASVTTYQKIITGAADCLPGNHAIQQTTANKPYLRVTPTTNKPWYDSNTATGALNVTFASALGRRNLLTYTEDFSSAQWPKENLAIVANAEVAPDGVLSADLMYTTTTTTLARIVRDTNPLLTNGVTYTQSLYVKSAGKRWVYLNGVDASSPANDCYFDLQNGVVGTKGASVLSAGITSIGNGWYRIFTVGVSGANDYFFLKAVDANNSGTSTANGTDGIYIWGAQLELGSTPTDYQKIVAGPSAALDPAALAATYPQNISASTNCTIACVTPEGVVIADNQTVGTTYNICPPYGYNSDVLIINRALTPAEKALVTRVMQRSVPVLGSELVTNGAFDTDTTGWTAINSSVLSVVDGKLSVLNTADEYGRAVSSVSTTEGNHYIYKFSFIKDGRGVTALGTYFTGNDIFQIYFLDDLSMSVIFAATSTSVSVSVGNLDNLANIRVFFDDISIKAIL